MKEIEEFRIEAEELLKEAKGARKVDAQEMELEEIIHELQVHQIELKLQNEELRSIQEKLSATKDKYHSLYELAPVAYFTFDQKGIIKEVNFTGARLLGVQVKRLLDKPLLSYLSSQAQVDFYRHSQFVFTTGEKAKCELKMKRRDGNSFYVHLESVLAKNENSNQPCLRSAMIDITEEKKVKKELKRRRDFEQIVNDLAMNFINLPVEEIDQGIDRALKEIADFARVDKAQILIFAQGEKRINNYYSYLADDRAELVSVNFQNLPWDQFKWLLEKMSSGQNIYIPDLKELPKSASAERRLLKEYNMESLVAVPMIYEGSLYGFLCLSSSSQDTLLSDNMLSSFKVVAEMLVNALQRKKAQDVLEKSEQKYRALVSNSSDAILVADTDGNLLEANQEAEELFGYSREEFEELNVVDIHPSSELKSARKSFVKAIEEGGVEYNDTLIKRKDGQLVHVDIRGSLVSYGGQDVLQGAFREITERKRAEEQLALYTMELENANSKIQKSYDCLNKELEKARELHTQFLPTFLPEIEELSFAAYYQPAANLGGDFYNIFKYENKLIVYIVDITGHGLDGAMLNIFVRETINSYLLAKHKNGTSLSPQKIIEFIFDKYCQESFPDDYFICILLGVLNLDTMKFSFTNAGIQVAPLIVDREGKHKLLSAGGLPISAMIEEELFKEQSITEEFFTLSKGTTVLLTTDGLIEEVAEGEIFGESRLRELMLNSYDLPIELLIDNIHRDFNNYTGAKETQDDITIMALRRDFEILDTFKKEIASKYQLMEECREEVAEFLTVYISDIDPLMMGFQELLTNAIEHGNQLDEEKSVEVEIVLKQGYLKIVIEDQGPGFDWQSKIDKDLAEVGFAERGRGIIMSKMAYDAIYYNQKGNKVTVIKSR